MDWFKGNFTGKPHIYWENLWFPVDFPLNQSMDRWIDFDMIQCEAPVRQRSVGEHNSNVTMVYGIYIYI